METAPASGERAMQFVHSVHNSFGFPTCELRYGIRQTAQRVTEAVSQNAQRADGGHHGERVARQVDPPNVCWRHNNNSHFQLDIRGHTLTVVKWLQGQWRCQGELRGLREQVVALASAAGAAGEVSRGEGDHAHLPGVQL